MIKETGNEKIFGFVNIFIISLFILVIALPLLNVVLSSFISPQEAAERSIIIIPRRLSLDAYKLILRGSTAIMDGYKITVLRVVIGTFLNMVFTYFLAYAIAKDDLPGKRGITIFIFFIMLFSGGLIPYYIIVKATHLYNSFWVYIIPGLVSAYNILLIRNFIMQIPGSYSESAEIDGASELTILLMIIMPLSIPAMVTVSLFYAVAHWNDWFTAYLFIRDSNKYPVQAVLRDILINTSMTFDGKNKHTLDMLIDNPPPTYVLQDAAVIITTLPIMLVYPFLQKYFIKGIMIGGIKG